MLLHIYSIKRRDLARKMERNCSRSSLSVNSFSNDNRTRLLRRRCNMLRRYGVSIRVKHEKLFSQTAVDVPNVDAQANSLYNVGNPSRNGYNAFIALLSLKKVGCGEFAVRNSISGLATFSSHWSCVSFMLTKSISGFKVVKSKNTFDSGRRPVRALTVIFVCDLWSLYALYIWGLEVGSWPLGTINRR